MVYEDVAMEHRCLEGDGLSQGSTEENTLVTISPRKAAPRLLVLSQSPEQAGEAIWRQRGGGAEQRAPGSPSCIEWHRLLIGNQQLHIKSLPFPTHCLC